MISASKENLTDRIQSPVFSACSDALFFSEISDSPLCSEYDTSRPLTIFLEVGSPFKSLRLNKKYSTLLIEYLNKIALDKGGEQSVTIVFLDGVQSYLYQALGFTNEEAMAKAKGFSKATLDNFLGSCLPRLLLKQKPIIKGWNSIEGEIDFRACQKKLEELYLSDKNFMEKIDAAVSSFVEEYKMGSSTKVEKPGGISPPPSTLNRLTWVDSLEDEAPKNLLAKSEQELEDTLKGKQEEAVKSLAFIRRYLIAKLSAMSFEAKKGSKAIAYRFYGKHGKYFLDCLQYIVPKEVSIFDVRKSHGIKDKPKRKGRERVGTINFLLPEEAEVTSVDVKMENNRRFLVLKLSYRVNDKTEEELEKRVENAEAESRNKLAIQKQ